jgi:DNA-binding transcriptional MocR family regulator
MAARSTERIADDLRTWVTGSASGTRLPSTRALVSQYGASPITIQKAMKILAGEGLIHTVSGVGTFVRQAPETRASDYGWQTATLGSPRARGGFLSSALRDVPDSTITLHSGYPHADLLPQRIVRAAFGRVSRSQAPIERSPAAGSQNLRAWFAGELGRGAASGRAAPHANDVIIVPGSQSGLSTSFRALVGAGRPIIMESPTYWGGILAAEQAGVPIVPVPAGPHGPDLETLERAFVSSGARAFYAQPSFANPTGSRWSEQRSRDVLALVRSFGAFLIEDDWAQDFGIDLHAPTPLAANDDEGHVVYIRSLTKSVSPDVRVAAIVARGPAKDRLLSATQADFMYVSGALQAVALDVVTNPSWATHLKQLRRQLTQRRDLLVDAVRANIPSARVETPPGGLNLWVRLPDGTDVARLVRDCEAHGVMIAAGDEWFPAEPAGPFLRLNFSGPHPDRFSQGASIIGQQLQTQA